VYSASALTVPRAGGRRVRRECLHVAGFPYDLAEGVDEGLVQTVLTVGHHTSCTRFDDFKGKDGSDGKKWQ
jgi:hypothetical protein